MKKLTYLLILLLAGCAPRIVYRIPEDKKEAAAKLTAELWDKQTRAGRNPAFISDDVRAEVDHIYAEPVVIKP